MVHHPVHTHSPDPELHARLHALYGFTESDNRHELMPHTKLETVKRTGKQARAPVRPYSMDKRAFCPRIRVIEAVELALNLP